ncbi:MAG: hypothetical protein OEW41_02265 [Actinomycetota bacterium]|nr:hypothetical protein [Actinomycetota bacterium]
MAAWGTAMKTLVKWGPVVFEATRRAWPYLKDNPAAQKFAQSLAQQTAAIPERLSAELRARRKIDAVSTSLAEAAVLGIDPTQYAGWRHELDELSRTVTLAKAASRPQRKQLLRQVERRLDQLVAEILPTLAKPAPARPELPPTPGNPSP